MLVAVTAGLIALAGQLVYGALQARLSDAEPSREARERVFAVNVITIAPDTIVPEMVTFGEVRSRRTLELRAAQGGEIVWLAPEFEDGGSVVEGALLLRIDDQDARGARDTAQADLEEAQADLRDTERRLVLAEDELGAASDLLALRQRALTRQRNLFDRDVGTEAAVEDAEIAVSSARQTVLSRRQSLAQAEAAVDQASTALRRRQIALAEAERALADTEIRARFSGVLAEVAVVEGGIVSANERLGQLVDPTALEAVFRVSTPQYARLLDLGGQLPDIRVAVSLDVLGIDLFAEGRITRESAVVSEGQTGRQLFAALEGAPGFRPGDFVTVALSEPPLSNVVRLPATAVDGRETVLVVGQDERLETAPVTLLRRQGDDVIVQAAGIEGREVVAERTPFLGDGIRVRPIRPTSNAEADAPELVELDDERRARLVAFIEGNERMPSDAKERLLAQLSQPQVPARMVARIEARMGG
ncbi:MAG: HlyD family efflux transporter periplasmic adaptor subunit [Pseudomonadota bacterium]